MMILSSMNNSPQASTAWRAAQRGPPPSSCANRAFTVKRAPPHPTGPLARLAQPHSNWDRQVGQAARDVEKDASVPQVRQGGMRHTLTTGSDVMEATPEPKSFSYKKRPVVLLWCVTHFIAYRMPLNVGGTGGGMSIDLYRRRICNGGSNGHSGPAGVNLCYLW